MGTNTDPVRAHDELRVQAALLRTPEFMAQFDPEKFARQLERIAAALAQQPPSAPVGVDEAAAIRAFEEHFQASSDDPYFEGELELWLTAWRKALAAQQPEARGVVDDAMVDRAGQALYGTDWGSFEGWEADQLRRKVRAVLTAALASASPSVPVGVDREEEYAALPHQPAAADEARSVSSILDGAVSFVEALAAQLQGGRADGFAANRQEGES